MADKPLNHGRDHRFGGTDQITDISAAAFVTGVSGGPLSITSSASTTTVPWLNFWSGNDMFGTDTGISAAPPYHNTAGDKYLYFTYPGAYFVSAMALFEPGAFAQAAIVTDPGFQWALDQVIANPYFAEEVISTNVPPGGFSGGVTGLKSAFMFYVDSSDAPGIVSLEVAQTSGGAKNLTAASMGIMYLGAAGDFVNIY